MTPTEESRRMDALFCAVSPSYRLQKAGIKIDGGAPLDFSRYVYVPKIIDSRARLTTIIKGAQLGLSIGAILWLLEIAREAMLGMLDFHLRGLAYWMPTAGDAMMFSKARFTPMMEENAHYWPPHQMDVSSAELKRFGDTSIYLRGAGQKGGGAAKSTSPVKSIPVDAQACDEFDEMDPARVDAIHHRLDGSEHPMEMMLSTPTLPEFGVDLLYRDSNQNHAMWKCPRCNGWTCFEDHYPDCIAEPEDGDPFYLCMKCREPHPRMFGGEFEWVPAKPDVRDHEGFYASQMCSPIRTARDVLIEHDNAVKRGRMREFYNQVLARPYADIEDRISEVQLNELLTEEPKPLRHPGPCAMGVDPGKPHWYTVRLRVSDRDYVQIDRGRCDTYEELAAVAKKYNVKAGCMDQGADTTAVRRFVDAHPGWWGVLYVNQKNTSHDWNHREKLVKVGRTVLLDQARDTILEKRIRYPRKDEFWHDQFVPQMTNLARTVIESPETGTRVSKWVVTGGQKNDHLRHADAYADLACERVPLSDEVRRSRQNHRQQARKPRSFMAA